MNTARVRDEIAKEASELASTAQSIAKKTHVKDRFHRVAAGTTEQLREKANEISSTASRLADGKSGQLARKGTSQGRRVPFLVALALGVALVIYRATR
jgi:hypothetical protein